MCINMKGPGQSRGLVRGLVIGLGRGLVTWRRRKKAARVLAYERAKSGAQVTRARAGEQGCLL
jgi:hypothetical protein